MIKHKNIYGEYEFNEKTKELIFKPNFINRVFKYKGLDDITEKKGSIKYDYQVVKRAWYGLKEIYEKYNLNKEELK
jgi:hypothetical protein